MLLSWHVSLMCIHVNLCWLYAKTTTLKFAPFFIVRKNQFSTLYFKIPAYHVRVLSPVKKEKIIPVVNIKMCWFPRLFSRRSRSRALLSCNCACNYVLVMLVTACFGRSFEVTIEWGSSDDQELKVSKLQWICLYDNGFGSYSNNFDLKLEMFFKGTARTYLR